MKNIFVNYAYNLSYQMFILLVPLITAPILARTLGANQLGIFSYVSSSTTIIYTVGLIGLYSFGVRQVAFTRENKYDLSNTFWNIIYIRLVLSILTLSIYFIIFKDSEYLHYFILYIPFLLSQLFDVSWIFVGIENMKPAVIKNFLTKIITILFIVFFIKEEKDLGLYFLVISISTLFGNMIVIPQLRFYISKPEKINLFLIREIIRGSFYLFIPQVAVVLYLQVDKVMIKYFTDTTDQIAYYDYAQKLINIPTTLILTIGIIMMPRLANEFSKHNMETISKLVEKTIKIVILLSLPLLFGIISISDKFIPWYLGNDFSPVIITMKVLSPMIILNSLLNVSGSQFFVATKQTKKLTISNILGLTLNVILNVFLIPEFGIIGASITTLISTFLVILIQYYYLYKQIGVKFIMSSLLKYSIFAFAMFLVIKFTTLNLDVSAITTLIQVTIGFIFYLLLLLISKDKLLEELISIIQKKLKGDI